MHEHDPEVAQLPGPQALELGRGRPRLQHLGLLHQRAHHERLAAGPELLPDPVIGPLALAGTEHTNVWIGRRPAGSSRSSVKSRSP